MKKYDQVDWEDQWRLHGHHFCDGFVHVDLSLFGPHREIIRLQPGPGFGDLSHPTTRLALRLMSELDLKNKIVVDIGCGSGVLSVAAAVMGASQVIGVDIEEEVLEHSRRNAKINEVAQQCVFCLPNQFVFRSSHVIVVMNMIWSEQMKTWEALPQLYSVLGNFVTSGVRVEEKEKYLELVKRWGWKPIREYIEEGWIVFLGVK